MKGVIEISFEIFEFSNITKIEFNNASRASIPVINNSVFTNIKLNETALPIQNDRNYPIISRNFANPEILENKKLLIFENNLSFEFSDHFNEKFKKYS